MTKTRTSQNFGKCEYLKLSSSSEVSDGILTMLTLLDTEWVPGGRWWWPLGWAMICKKIG